MTARVRSPQPDRNPAVAIHDPQGRVQRLTDRIARFRADAKDPDLAAAERLDARRMANELAAELGRIQSAARIGVAA